jgi:hypothetical protein
MQSNHSELLTPDGLLTMTVWELRLMLDAIGDKADALMAKATAQNDDNALDEAWELIELFNKLNGVSTMRPLRGHPAPIRRRRTVVNTTCNRAF